MKPFWNFESTEHVAIVDSQLGSFTYRGLQEEIDKLKTFLPSSKKKCLGLLLCKNTVSAIATYLAALQLGDAVMLLDYKLDPSLLEAVIDRYQPDWIYSPGTFETYPNYKPISTMILHRISQTNTIELYSDLAVLLSTSGTTGSPKFVRLSYRNIQSNAESIALYLGLNETERAVSTLPMHYSYGLSVINSHLAVNGTLLLTNDSLVSKSFWMFIKENEATSFSGVPYMYQILDRLRFGTMHLPSLRYFTQAGGRLAPNLLREFYVIAQKLNCRFFIMYGQTEATARMSYVPPERLQDKLESIGISVPNGKLYLDSENSELIYEGPNVMLGYAETREDLSKGDELGGKLHTGDIAEVDQEGYFYLKGRIKRFIKVFGLRLNLDEIESQIEKLHSIAVACVEKEERLEICINDGSKLAAVQHFVRDTYKLHKSAFEIHVISDLPRLPNGKTNYSILKEMIL